MNLIKGMSGVTDPEWIQALLAALDDTRDAVAEAAAEVLSDTGSLGMKDALIGLGNHVLKLSMTASRFNMIVSKFLSCVDGAKNWQDIPEVRNTLNRLSTCSDETIRKRLQQIMVTPENVSDDYVQNLIQKILNDRCDSAAPRDVLLYQEAVDELGRLISNDFVSDLAPLFTHHYWRVRKHAVMLAKIALPRISGSERKKLLNALHTAAHDPDDTVSAIAYDFI